MGKLSKRFLLGLVAAAVLLVGALLVAPQFIPVEIYKRQIITQGEAITGRKIAINGDVSLRFLPQVRLLLQDVYLSNPKDFGAEANADMVSLKELRLSLGFFELLSGKIIVDQFELIDPVIHLRKNAQGRANWEFDIPEKAVQEKAAADKASGIQQIQVPAFTLRNGTFRYSEPGQDEIHLSKLDADVEAPSLTSPATLKVTAIYGKDLPLSFIAHLKTPQLWLDGKEVDVALEASAGSGNALTEIKFEGKATPAENGISTAKGHLQAGSESLKSLGKALGTTILPDSLKGKGEFELVGAITYQDPKVTLNELTIELDNLKLNGDGAVNLSGDRPGVTATLASPDVLTVNDLFASSPAGDGASVSPAASTAPDGWSNEPIFSDTAFLNAANADIRLSLGGVKYDALVLGALNAHATLQQGKLAVNIPDFAFYDGKAGLNFTLAAPGKSAAITGATTLANIDVGKFLREFQSFDKLEGKGDITLNVNTNGVSMRDFVNHLGGNGSLKMADGAIKGINIAETVRNARSLLSGKGIPEDAATGSKTDFAELGATFTIAQGIVSNNDLSLKAPLLTLTGQGNVDLPQRRVDYRLRPTVVTTLEGQGRTADAKDALTIPLKVTGTFDKLHFAPDLQDTVKNTLKDAIQDPEKAKQDLKDLKSGIKGLLKGL